MISGWWQTDRGLDPNIQEGGCAYLSSIYWLPDPWSIDQVNAMYAQLVKAKILTEECEVNSWQELLSVLPSGGTHPLRFSMIAGRGYVCRPNEREIIKWYLSNVDEDHFTPGDGDSHVAWDSMNRPDIMARYATLVQKVILTVPA